MALFPITRSLLYPQFETYRLHPLDPSSDVSSYPLPGSGATQSRLEHGQHNLSFKEVRGRIGWDHLALGGEGRGVYVDKEWNVVGFELDDDLIPHFSILASLPQPISTASSSRRTPEYPSAVALTPRSWAISAGSGHLYILRIDAQGVSGSFTALYDIDSPILIRATHIVSPTDVRLLLSRSVVGPDSKRGRSSTTTFELLEILLDPTANSDVDHPVKLEPRWILQGGDLPIHCAWADDGWMLLSGETHGSAKKKEDEADEVETDLERRKREKNEKIGKLGLGASLPLSDDGSTPDPPPVEISALPTPKDQALSWTQTGDSASIRIPFAAGTKRSDLNIVLTSGSLGLSLSGGPDQSEILQRFLRYAERSWWAEIDLDLSSLSFDTSKSILEIDIAKIDSNHRWPALFLPADDEDDSADIPETLNASTLAAVRDTFNNIRTRNADEPEGNHPAIPSLLREEMDFDMEDGEDFEDRAAGATLGDAGGKIGREMFIGKIRDDGETSWSKMSTTVISLPLQSGGTRGGGAAADGEIVIKSAVDGLLFSPPVGKDSTKSPWEHQATIPALAFVLSSKRDIRLVRHLTPVSPAAAAEPSSKKARIDGAADISARSSMSQTERHPTVLAFDSGSSSAGQGNVYIYYPPTSKTTAKQGVVRVSGAERGAMLGVGVIRKGGKDVVLALCEKELVVLHGVMMV